METLVNKNIVFFVSSRIVKTTANEEHKCFRLKASLIIYFSFHLYVLRCSTVDPTMPIVYLKCRSIPPSIFVWFIPFQVFLIMLY